VFAFEVLLDMNKRILSLTVVTTQPNLLCECKLSLLYCEILLGIRSSGIFTYSQTECMSEESSRFKILDLALKDLTWPDNLVWL
jgi:hypothetical protein